MFALKVALQNGLRATYWSLKARANKAVTEDTAPFKQSSVAEIEFLFTQYKQEILYKVFRIKLTSVFKISLPFS